MERESLLTHNEKDRKMEKLTNIELTSIATSDVKARSFASPQSPGLDPSAPILVQEDDFETPYGNIRVAVQGDKHKPAIITFHDIGLNHITCFQGFFSYTDMQPILRHFCVYHVNAPGQEELASQLSPMIDIPETPDGHKPDYPSMDQLAELISIVTENYNIAHFIGVGVGAGANILCRYALHHPNAVDALVMVNPTPKAPGWIEWGYQKVNNWYLNSGQMTNFTEEYLLWHWFGNKTRWGNHDLVTVYSEYIKALNPHNLALFTGSYIKRNDLGLVRELNMIKRNTPHTALKCRSMIIVGDDSPHCEDAVEMNGRMDPQETDFMKIADCGGMPLEEQPGKVCEALKLFLQGMGYVPALRQSHSVASRSSEMLLAANASPVHV